MWTNFYNNVEILSLGIQKAGQLYIRQDTMEHLKMETYNEEQERDGGEDKIFLHHRSEKNIQPIQNSHGVSEYNLITVTSWEQTLDYYYNRFNTGYFVAALITNNHSHHQSWPILERKERCEITGNTMLVIKEGQLIWKICYGLCNDKRLQFKRPYLFMRQSSQTLTLFHSYL